MISVRRVACEEQYGAAFKICVNYRADGEKGFKFSIGCLS